MGDIKEKIKEVIEYLEKNSASIARYALPIVLSVVILKFPLYSALALASAYIIFDLKSDGSKFKSLFNFGREEPLGFAQNNSFFTYVIQKIEGSSLKKDTLELGGEVFKNTALLIGAYFIISIALPLIIPIVIPVILMLFSYKLYDLHKEYKNISSNSSPPLLLTENASECADVPQNCR